MQTTLEALRRAVRDTTDASDRPSERARLDYLLDERGVCLFFFGAPDEEGFGLVLEALRAPDLASAVSGLWFDGPDVGANGTREWDLSPLVGDGPALPALRELHLPQTAPGHHNHTVMGYDEGGVTARLLEKAPALTSLTIPSAPDPAFFDVEAPCLEQLAVDAGYDHQGFVGRLAEAVTLPSLTTLQWGEYCETYMDDWLDEVTPVADVDRLIRSALGTRLSVLTLKNPVADEATLRRWAELRPSLLVIRSSSSFPAHSGPGSPP